ncbi:MAG: threonine--tRNA ligase [Finegoldia sp.]|nr:threonine--tRNA ligase [Finegoldia sp.]
MFKVRLKDGSVKEFEGEKSLFEICQSISEGLARVSVGAVVDGVTRGLQETVDHDCQVEFVKFDDEEGKKVFWHTSSHLMAAAIKRLYPGTKFAIGPATDQGFYYDLDTDHVFVPEDLEKIEAEMKKIVKENPKLIRKEISRADALERFEKEGEIYKVDLIENLPEDETISLYEMGDFTDLCRGPHLKEVKDIKAFKLLSIAGAYWRGDENNKMLQRIYGISFPKKKMLDEYLERIEEAKKRDHRKIGKEMDLFSIQEEGPGFPFFHPNGMVIINEIEGFLKEQLMLRGYGQIKTPLILNEELWHRSGHWDHYKENMYFTKIDGEDYAIKPMNCPGAILEYKNDLHSYRDFPIRFAELGQVHRHELSGALHGLFRVRTFVQDDGHIFCLQEQIQDEVSNIIDLCDFIYTKFGFKYSLELSTRPDDSMGSDEEWDIATEALKKALEANNMEYKINEGDGAFYGPKIDYHLEDAIGRTWQCGTIQLDFQMPERFDLSYVASDGEKKKPVMIHRAILGSEERFLGILVENYAGKFPLWLSPVQVEILPLSEKFNDYSYELANKMKARGIRVKVDDRNEKIGLKIRESQLKRVNYSLVIGQKEIDEDMVAVRKRDEGEVGSMKTDDFIEKIYQEYKTRA